MRIAVTWLNEVRCVVGKVKLHDKKWFNPVTLKIC